MTKSYEDQQAKWVKENNLKVGDTVVITRVAEYNERGWEYEWPLIGDRWTMDKCEVYRIAENGILLYNPKADDCWYFPYFVLKKEDSSSTYTETKKVQSANEWTVSFGLKVRTGDPVLVRDGNYENWQYSLFSHVIPQIPFRYYTVGNPFLECIPYVGNEHLLGTMEPYQ